jgi:hypothetical protein
MTAITSTMLATMHARRLNGEDVADIARSYGLKAMTVYQRLRREHGLDIYKQRQRPANDNVPGTIVRMSPHNGGCSTLSGMVPVTLAASAPQRVAA